MTKLTKLHTPLAATAAVAAAVGASAALAAASAHATATPATTGTTLAPTVSPWDPASISPAGGAVIKNGEPNFRWKLPAADAYSASYILVSEKRDARVTANGKLVETRNSPEGVGNTLGWPKADYLWTKDDGASPLPAGHYLWQIQSQDANTGTEDDMPVHAFTVPAWIKLGRLSALTYPDPSRGNYVIQFDGNLLGNINNEDSMQAHPKDSNAEFVCDGTGYFTLGRRTILVAHEKQDCSSSTVQWGKVVFAVHNSMLKAPAGARVTAYLTVSGDGLTVKSNRFSFIQP